MPLEATFDPSVSCADSSPSEGELWGAFLRYGIGAGQKNRDRRRLSRFLRMRIVIW